jgi:hypothetical protein
VTVNTAYPPILAAAAASRDRPQCIRQCRAAQDYGLIISSGSSDGNRYDTSQVHRPDFGHRDRSLQVSWGIKQSLLAYDQKAITTGVTINRKLCERVERERRSPHRMNKSPKRASATTTRADALGVSYDSTNLASPLDDPTPACAIPEYHADRAFGRPSATFNVGQVKTRHLFRSA